MCGYHRNTAEQCSFTSLKWNDSCIQSVFLCSVALGLTCLKWCPLLCCGCLCIPATLRLAHREPGLFNLENCWNNSGPFEFDATVITTSVLICLASDPICGNVWIPCLQWSENEQIKDCHGFRDDGNGVSQVVLEKCNIFLLCCCELALVAFTGVQSVSPLEPHNSDCDSGRTKVGTGFVVGLQFPPRAPFLVVLLKGFLEFWMFWHSFLVCGRTVAYPSCP